MKISYLFAILLVALTIAGAVQVAFAQQQKVLIIAMTTDLTPIDLNPVRLWSTSYWPALIDMPVIAWDKNGAAVPGLALTWNISSDGLTQTYHLRPGMVWSDGQPITSEDVAFNCILMSEQALPWYSYWASIQAPSNTTATGFTVKQGAIETPDSNTIIFHLEVPDATFAILAMGSPVVPKHSFSGMDLNKVNPDVSKQAVSGPFIPQELDAGDKLVLTANANYYNGRPQLDEVIFKEYKDTTSAEIALENGEAGLAITFPYFDIPTLSKDPDLQVGTEPNQVFQFGDFNFGNKLSDGSVNPCTDINVRKAIVMSLNMANILNESIGQGYLLANQMQVPNMYYLGKSVYNTTIPTWYPYDPNASAKLLDAAGYKAGADGVRFTLKFLMSSTGRYSQTSNILKLTQLMQSQLKAVGINMELDMMEHSSYEAELFAAQPKSWNVAFAGVSESPDPTEVTYQVRSDIAGNVGQGGWNWGAYINPTVSQLAHLGETTPDVDKRVAIYQQLSGIIFDNVVLIPLYYPQEAVAWNKQYQGFILGLGNPPHDYWGALKYQSLAQVTIVQATTTSAQMTTTTTAPDYTMVSIIAAIVVIVVGAIAYTMGRRGKKAS